MFSLCVLEPQNMKNKTPNPHHEDNMSPIALVKHKKNLNLIHLELSSNNVSLIIHLELSSNQWDSLLVT